MVVSQGRLPRETSSESMPNRERSHWCVAYLCSQTCQVVQDGIGRRVEYLVLIEGLDSQRFVFDQESIHFDSSIVGYVQIVAHSYFRGSNDLRLWKGATLPCCGPLLRT